MAMLPSHAHVECILNGTRFDTWADDDPPYEFETDDSASLTLGMSGRTYGNGSANFGGRLMLRLAPHSPGVQQLIKWEIERKNRLLPSSKGGSPNYAQVFSGTLEDVVTGLGVTLDGGTIIKIPARTIAGQTFEATFQFERCTIKIDGAHDPFGRFGEYPGAGRTPGYGTQ
ncbi:MAG: hypothetical protein ISN29_01625 [Gammaproteobacteria bacterium AqS3]|nr:hypothetical protein [Gammaproteobacteria bacterium AqS3]